MNKTLAIIGSHPRTRAQFDMARADVDVWLFNEARSNADNHAWAKRADVVFQMHVPAIWRNPANRNDPKHYEWLTTQRESIVYMQDEYAEVPMSKKYPLDEILDMLGRPQEHFLTSSVPQALALAAYLDKYDRVEVYGVAMETNTEYGFQREGVAFWLGYLRGRGIDTYFADQTFVAPLYGYEGEVAISYERFGERISELTPHLDKLTAEYKAAKLTTDASIEKFMQGADMETEKQLYEAVMRQRELGEQLGIVDGAMQENRRYKGKADKMREASGGEFVFSRQEFESGAKNMSEKANQAAMTLNSLGTVLQILHANISKAAKGSPKREKFMQEYLNNIGQYMNTSNALGIYKGISSENFGYMSYLDKRIKAAGGSKSEEVLLEVMKAQEKVELVNA